MNTLKFLLICFLLSTFCCTPIKQIGKVNMISNRNVDPDLDYKMISSYETGSKKLKKSKAGNIEEAIDQVVRDVPGGEFLMNAKIYLVKDKYFAVEGDVWGEIREISYKGFKVGDKVTWKNKSLGSILGKDDNYLTGTITSLKSREECLVTVDDTKEVITMPYDELSKL